MSNWLLILFAGLLLALIPITPKLLQLRIRFFRWIRWEWAARILEDHFVGWCRVTRAAFLVIAVVLLILGIRVDASILTQYPSDVGA